MNNRKKHGGRTKGTPNKQTAKIKEVVHSLLADNIDQLQNDLDLLEPKDRINTMLKLLDYAIPKKKPEIEEETEELADITIEI
ncbi:MAG: hypothetical protein JEZ01_03135 [Labilibaculum sp.]|nr:hypothetical protein [Labilibaculum sp.]MBI9056746.1 hypothetical protein [Labilibaculum sp.]